jgi:uncharacterized iron-regulated membrane protein
LAASAHGFEEGAMMNTSLYRAVWRWHFYAGLFVLPFLVWLAVTGGLYLYKPEVERLVYRDWIQLDAAAEAMPAADMIRRVQERMAGEVTQVIRPASRQESWRMTVKSSDGALRTAFVDPTDGVVLGLTRDGGVMKTIRDLHSLAITGPIGNALIEIVAGGAIVLVLTGFYLWWPRGGQRALALRGRPRERRFWRDFHASAGAVVGGVILFLAVTGMPWSVFWGANVQQMAAANGLGRPKAPGPQPWEAEGGHGHGAVAERSLPWALQAAPPPHAHSPGDIGVEQALAVADKRGLAPPYTLNLPVRPGTPYSISRTPDRAGDARVIYVDPGTGQILQDVSYADFGPAAQAIEWGIYTHQGQQYGEANRLVMLAGCIGVVLLAISAPVLWWKRRRNGRLEAPPRPTRSRDAKGVAALMLLLGLLYPLTGIAMIVVAGLDWMARQAWQTNARA